VLPALVLRDFAGPAAGALLHPSQYASAVLASGGSITRDHIAFSYWSASDVLIVAATVVLAVPCAIGGARLSERPIVTFLRRIQSGSVNDYASYLVGGLVITVAVLAR
jgi:multicomponent Na+:H+ antiporter subunit D